MGTMICVFSENKEKFFQCVKYELKPDGLRRVLASRLRYCIGDKYFYAPIEQDGLDIERDRLCWVRDRELYSLEALDRAYRIGELTTADVRISSQYLKRRKEEDGRFVEVENFVSKELYNGLIENPETFPSLSKDDFEGLCAEIYAKRGFEVDLFRSSQDGGIDFLAVNGDEIDPLILAVQCKQPDMRPGKPRRSLGRPVVQQIYGAAKAWDMSGAVAISGAQYSPQAMKFAKNKPQEIAVHNQTDVLNWMRKYRWNDGE